MSYKASPTPDEHLITPPPTPLTSATMTYPKTGIKKEPVTGTPQENLRKFKVEELTSEPYADLYEETDECDLENSEQVIWLVKLPQFVQDRWDDIPSDSEEVIELGTVLINKHDSRVGPVPSTTPGG